MKLEKGIYYVGDPCYLFDKSWSEVLQKAKYFMDKRIVELFGVKCFAASTKEGDGTYDDNFGRSYAVDAGIIGVMPISLINIDKEQTHKSIEEADNMHIINFEKDFEVKCEDGLFTFGDIIIDTIEEEEESYFEDYGNDDEDTFDDCYDEEIEG